MSVLLRLVIATITFSSAGMAAEPTKVAQQLAKAHMRLAEHQSTKPTDPNEYLSWQIIETALQVRIHELYRLHFREQNIKVTEVMDGFLIVPDRSGHPINKFAAGISRRFKAHMIFNPFQPISGGPNAHVTTYRDKTRIFGPSILNMLYTETTSLEAHEVGHLFQQDLFEQKKNLLLDFELRSHQIAKSESYPFPTPGYDRYLTGEEIYTYGISIRFSSAKNEIAFVKDTIQNLTPIVNRSLDAFLKAREAVKNPSLYTKITSGGVEISLFGDQTITIRLRGSDDQILSEYARHAFRAKLPYEQDKVWQFIVEQLRARIDAEIAFLENVRGRVSTIDAEIKSGTNEKVLQKASSYITFLKEQSQAPTLSETLFENAQRSPSLLAALADVNERRASLLVREVLKSQTSRSLTFINDTLEKVKSAHGVGSIFTALEENANPTQRIYQILQLDDLPPNNAVWEELARRYFSLTTKERFEFARALTVVKKIPSAMYRKILEKYKEQPSSTFSRNHRDLLNSLSERVKKNLQVTDELAQLSTPELRMLRRLLPLGNKLASTIDKVLGDSLLRCVFNNLFRSI